MHAIQGNQRIPYILKIMGQTYRNLTWEFTLSLNEQCKNLLYLTLFYVFAIIIS